MMKDVQRTRGHCGVHLPRSFSVGGEDDDNVRRISLYHGRIVTHPFKLACLVPDGHLRRQHERNLLPKLLAPETAYGKIPKLTIQVFSGIQIV